MLIVFILTAGCKDLGEPSTEPPIPIPHDVSRFVMSQQLPKAQEVEIFVEVAQHHLVGFKVQYGEAHDCIAGCFYSIAYGLRRDRKIAWIYVKDYDGNEISRLEFYDVDSSDSYFYSQDFWDKLNATESWFYHYALLPAFVKDTDTPVDVLKRLAESLYSYIYDYLGWLLLDNPKVASSREILTIIANLPHFQNDGYDSLRAKAQEMLRNLGN